MPFDPGSGSGRYRRALEFLGETGEPRAVAAFTFDPEMSGSMVVVPVAAPPAETEETSPGTVVDDGEESWRRGLATAMTAIASGRVEKVVASRRVEYRFDRPVDPLSVFSRLRAGDWGTYHFLVDGLVGASPELLVGMDRGRVEALALAGTAAVASDLDDSRIELEHTYAAASVAEVLERHTDRLSSARSVHTFGSLTHIGTRFTGRAGPATGVLDILADLHPTAAVAGTPAQAALELIREIEPDRGRYAGPVGWFDTEGNGEFAIALRCGQVSGTRVVLHAGGGLVAGSDPEKEWAETELKLAPMRAALGVEG